MGLSQHALAYFLGQLCGIKISESTSPDEIDPKDVLNQIGYNDKIHCPISQVFLISAMSTRKKRSKELHPNAPLYDYGGRAVFSSPEKLRARMSRLRNTLAAIQSS